MKKKRGSILSDMGVPLVTLIFISIIIISFLNFSKEGKRVNDLDRLGREYILRMESNGYLNDANRNLLIQELQALGAKNISVQGTMSQAPYGSKINLTISCILNVENIKLDGLKMNKTIESINYNDTWSSTSKH